MAVLAVKTKGDSIPDCKPKVYFTCHPEDFSKYFEKICDDIFKMHDCAIYYTEDTTEEFNEQNIEIDLNCMNLFVIPITMRLLTTANRTMNFDLIYAKEKHIPILPFMMEPGIDSFYAKPDKFGELQYISPYSRDLTEISYEEKLKKYLDCVLISKEMVEKIQKAFDAYIFLSYRKKDRKYANELMKLIHHNDKCQDVAIWYDEFLTPGESFKANIDRMLQQSKLFALLVTPNLLEEPDGKPNFVMANEYPVARNSGMAILPAEMIETDKTALSSKYEGIPECVDPYNDSVFTDHLLKLLGQVAITENKDRPEHSFLVGLAYLEGVDVEVDRSKALELITKAAKSGLPEAMKKLTDMYSNGIGVKLDYQKAVFWCEKLGEYYLNERGKNHPETIIALNNLAVVYQRNGELEKSSNVLYNICENAINQFGYENVVTIELLNNMAYIDNLLGESDRAIEIYELIYGVSKKVFGEFHSVTLTILNNVASCYFTKSEFEKAREFYEEVYWIRSRIHGSNHPYTLNTLNNIAVVLGKLGDYDSSYKLIKKVYDDSCITLGIEHPDTLLTLRNIANLYIKTGRLNEAESLYKTCLKYQRKVLGEYHYETLLTIRNLALYYIEIGKINNAVSLYETAFSEISLSNKTAKQLSESAVKRVCLDIAEDMFKLAFECFEKEEVHFSLSLYEMTYEIRKDILGEKNENTLMALSKLAYNCEEVGDHKRAVSLYIVLYDARYEILGSAHEDTMATLSNLAYSYESDGDYYNAAKINQQVYNTYLGTFGEYHSKTLTALNVLADSYRKIGNIEEMIALFEKAYNVCVKNAGPDHPITLKFEYSLANSCIEDRQVKKSYILYNDLYERFSRILGDQHQNTIIVKEKIECLKKFFH